MKSQVRRLSDGRRTNGRGCKQRTRVVEIIQATRVGSLTLLGTLMLASACRDSNNVIVPVPVAPVTVFRDTAFDFRVLRTFSMPDTIVHRVPASGEAAVVTREFDQAILNEVRTDLIALGYVEIKDPFVQPDFIMLVAATATDEFDAFSGYPWFAVWGFYDGWRWYTPGFSPQWSIVYPWASAVNITRFDRATLIIDLIPTSSVNAGTRTIRAAWTGTASGILSGVFSAVTVTSAVDKMFLLSPYINAP